MEVDSLKLVPTLQSRLPQNQRNQLPSMESGLLQKNHLSDDIWRVEINFAFYEGHTLFI